MRYKLVIILLTILFILCFYLFISKPARMVVNEKGKITGIFNVAREALQGNRFWKYQLSMAEALYESENKAQLPSSADMQTLYRKIREDQRLLDEKMKPLFTEEERVARSLREKADSLELTSKWKSIDDAAEAVRIQQLNRVKTVIPLIKAKLHMQPESPSEK